MDLGRLTEIPGTIILRMFTESYIGITKECSVYTGMVADDLYYLTKFLFIPPQAKLLIQGLYKL
ncbi:hypothetical protein LEMLEM_LOCUS11982 [Lemmus lemmus]